MDAAVRTRHGGGHRRLEHHAAAAGVVRGVLRTAGLPHARLDIHRGVVAGRFGRRRRAVAAPRRSGAQSADGVGDAGLHRGATGIDAETRLWFLLSSRKSWEILETNVTRSLRSASS